MCNTCVNPTKFMSQNSITAFSSDLDLSLTFNMAYILIRLNYVVIIANKKVIK